MTSAALALEGLNAVIGALAIHMEAIKMVLRRSVLRFNGRGAMADDKVVVFKVSRHQGALQAGVSNMTHFAVDVKNRRMPWPELADCNKK